MRLRSRLDKNPHSALLASNLGILLMQRGQYEEAGTWLEKAYAARYSLPDNGRRTLMLLHEVRRRQAKSTGPNEAVTEMMPAPPSPPREAVSTAVHITDGARPLPGRR